MKNRNEWITIKLGEIFETSSGGTPSRKNKALYSGGDIPWVKSGELSLGIIRDTEEKITETALKKSSAKLFPAGTLLIALYGATIGKLAFLGVEAATNQAVCGIFKNKEVSHELTYYYLLHRKPSLIKSAIGGAQPNISQRILRDSSFPIIPLPEQRAIVTKLDTLYSELDAGIAAFIQAKKQLKVYRQSILKQAFSGELTREWREGQVGLPTAEELLGGIEEARKEYTKKKTNAWERKIEEWNSRKVGRKPSKPKNLKTLTDAKAEEIAKLPRLPSEGWEYVKLAGLGELARGKSKHRPRNDKALFGGEYPFIQTGDVKATDLITEYSQTYNEIGLAQSRLWPKGTLCITIAANIAETGFLGMDACFPDSIVGFEPLPKVVSDNFIKFFFEYTRSKIEAFAPATAQKNINLNTLENLLFPICSSQEQHQIVQEIETRFSVCDQLEADIETNLKKSESLRQSLLKKAFAGELLTEVELAACRAEADWEPAGVLLARIKNKKKAKTK